MSKMEDDDLIPYDELEQLSLQEKSPQIIKESKKEVESPKELELNLTELEMERQINILYNLREKKRNRLILSYDEMTSLFKNIEKYKRKVIPDHVRAIERFCSDIISLNKDVIQDVNGLVYTEDIDLIKLEMNWNDICNNLKGILDPKEDPTYIYFFIENALTNSSRLFFVITTLSQTMVQFNLTQASIDLEPSPLGLFLYMTYIRNQYKDVCIVKSLDLDKLLSQAMEMNNRIEEYYQKDNVPEDYQFYVYLYELVKKYDFNYNAYYNYLLDSMIYENVILGIYYDFTIKFKNDRFHVDDDTYKMIRDCVDGPSRFILIPFTIVFSESAHQNILLIDKKNKTLERFEPHGYFEMEDSTDLEIKIGTLFPEYKFTSYSCMKGIQELETYLPNVFQGKCVTLSFGYLEYRLSHTDLRDAATEYLNYSIKKQLLYYKELVERNNKIYNSLTSEIFEINKKLFTSFKCIGNVLSFEKTKSVKPTKRKKQLIKSTKRLKV